MQTFEEDLIRLEQLGFCPAYRDRLREEHDHGEDPDAIRNFVRAIVCVYDDRKEYVDVI